jgi:single-strand DNA-binding protein
MPKGLNKVMLIGYIGKDPELRYIQSGTAVCTFSLAASETYKDRDGNQKEKTEWFNVVVWGKLAEIVGEYQKKGSRVYVEGKLQTRTYDDKEGIKRYITEVVMLDMVMLDSGNRAQRTQASAQEPATEPATAPATDSGDDDLPF